MIDMCVTEARAITDTYENIPQKRRPVIRWCWVSVIRFNMTILAKRFSKNNEGRSAMWHGHRPAINFTLFSKQEI